MCCVRCLIANSNTKFCDYGRSQRVTWAMVTIYRFILCRQPFCQHCKKVILQLSEHGDVIIEMQTACLAIHLLFWLPSEQHLATLDLKNLATLQTVVTVTDLGFECLNSALA